MKRFINLSFVAAISAFSNSEAEILSQKLFNEKCPSEFPLHYDDCQLYLSHPLPTTTNISSSPESTQVLSQASKLAEDVSNFPWSFRPECSPLETSQSVCVFSDQRFADGRGIFLITSPDYAHDISKRPEFTQLEAIDRISHHRDPPFVQQNFLGKGRGLVANRTLYRGEQILASTPLFLMDIEAYKLAEEERLRLAHLGVELLPDESKALLWSMSDHFNGDPIDGRIDTNAFMVYVNGVSYIAVIPESGMMNHDCRPNAAYLWDEETLTHYVHATQTIYSAQEITIAYIPNRDSRSERTKKLNAWGFNCSCSTCSANPTMIAESDRRLQKIADLEMALDDWSSNSEATPEMAETIVSLYHQERLFSRLGIPHKYAAEVYSSFGDKYNAIRHAELGAEYGALERGFRDKEVREMRAMARNPEMSWTWKRRLGLK
ncbi:hypothetical protein BS50DRAFT_507455 [Corynespora cassiicola Philippines]|uniref:SET domain-containing protein n=1 Tax=Corynespora cassiicola Philippines TaxID=1448308 RepID=A0A2T2N4I1_CORCC|nr:hypothetical protein BS50DRAFT_507455 [Corynespora cassiicola Philippines]